MKKKSDQYVPKICLLRKITYGEFSEFIREKKNTYNYNYLVNNGGPLQVGAMIHGFMSYLNVQNTAIRALHV